MVLNREEAALRAEAERTNTPGMCQSWTRSMFFGDSAGDQDGDGDADAIDGWKSEPSQYRHVGEDAPRGVPGAWRGGASGHGHRAVSLGGGLFRSTDFNGQTKRYEAGRVGTGTIEEISRAMGLVWLGWSDTITGEVIPLAPSNDSGQAKRPEAGTKELVRFRLQQTLDALTDFLEKNPANRGPFYQARLILRRVRELLK